MQPELPSVATDNEIASKFRAIDVDNDGSISIPEFNVLMRSQKIPLSASYMKELLENLDADQDGRISLPEFVKFYRFREQELIQSYMILINSMNDENKNAQDERRHKISATSLKRGLSALGIKASDNEIREFVSKLDVNNDGYITFEEYCSVLLLLPLNNPRATFDAFRSQFSGVDYGQSEYNSPIEKESPVESPTTKSLFGISSTTRTLLSGGFAGIISRSATAPIDRLKTIMQAGGPNASSGLIAGCKDIYSKGGFRSFYLGNGVNCAKVAPETAFKMVLFDRFKTIVSADPGAISASERFLAGGLAGATSQILVYPLEIVKTRLSLSAPGFYGGMFNCMSTIIRNEGLKSLYKGLSTSVLGVVPYAGIDLMVNSMLKEISSEYYIKKNLEPDAIVLLGTGMISSSTAMSITYPIGLVRTRLQASGMPGRPVYLGPMDCIKTIMKNEGVIGFFRGFFPNLLKVVPAAAVSYGVYDTLNKNL